MDRTRAHAWSGACARTRVSLQETVTAITRQSASRLLSGAAILVALLAVMRWWWFVHAGSVNLLYMDQWDLYRAFFDDYSIVETYRLQHGPHRQGLAFLLVGWINRLSGWNTRIDGFVIGAFVCGAAALAWWVKVRLSGRVDRHDCVLAVLFLNPLQYGLFANTPNLSHGAFPLFMVMLCCVCWTIKGEGLRWASVLACNFVLIFSGFGLFSGPVVIGLIGMELVARWRSEPNRWRAGMLVVLAVAAASLAVFFVGYTFEPAAPDFIFPVEQWWFQYPVFLLLMVTNLLGCGLGTPPFLLVLVGVPLVVLLAVVALQAAWRLLSSRLELPGVKLERSRAIVMLFLMAFTMAFCVNSAVGRITLGFSAAVQSRYVSYLIPALFALYLYVDACGVRVRPTATTVFLLVMVLTSLRLPASHRTRMAHLVDGKQAWRAAYLETRSIAEANERTGFVAYPWPEHTRMAEKLAYMEARGLNLFLEERRPPITDD